MSINVWEQDLLNREWDAEYLYRLSLGRNQENVRTQKSSFVLNIDAPWGQGKSFFLNAVYKTVLERGHPAVFINAWQYDFVDDPFSICVAALDEYFKILETQKTITKTEKFQKGLKIVRSQFLNITLTLGKAVLKKAINKVAENGFDTITESLATGRSHGATEKGFAEDVADTIEEQIGTFTEAAIDKFAQTQIDNINETKRSLGLFQGGLRLIIEAMGESQSHQLPMFIFVDELDRCRPTYAISMLERIKHIFDIPNVVFIISTDTESLSHSVKAVYGNEFRSREYLGRFFNRTYKLPAASNEKIILQMLQERGTDISKWSVPTRDDGIKNIVVFLDQTSSQYEMNIRPVKYAIEILMDITSAWDALYKIELTYLFTLICQFVKTGEIDDVAFRDKLQAIKGWNFELNYKLTSYKEIISGVGSFSNNTLMDAIDGVQKQINNGASPIYSYFHKILIEELDAGDRALAMKGPTSYSKYKGMILHSRHLT
ncbi:MULTISPECIES: KAP family P-loop NTPase fold protein [unclassified Rhizobium]|uniref:KAP family P-loop NTPase fold protein n=1 Tax=unclassified Rhizobium TaxID=2613769 RepID=UPI001783A041|nr:MULTISPECIES: P-loop NTPase fold protein [unclassified Rhizobium]MBD8687240.1 hypothetical protein [Rhizobium sp. CFBP 13644]MBD8691694.1 hypothetical protein [Rhizobium sp. CFBP 13717]